MLRNADMHIQGPQINQFNNISPRKIPRSSFRRDFTRRSTFNQDVLVPIFLDEILPGDEVNLSMSAQVRMSTPIKPLMDNLYFETFWFFIPNRLVWDNWEKFQGQQTNPGDSVAYTIPVLDGTKAPLSTTGFATESVYDYMGLPILVAAESGSMMSTISCLWNRAMDLCWNEWFRDENLQNSLTIQTGDGPDDPATYVLRTRNKRKDYFTSGLPWPQKGDPVSISLTGTAPVVNTLSGTHAMRIRAAASPYTVQINQAPITFNSDSSGNIDNGVVQVQLDPNGSLEVQGSSFTPITINALRQAALYQQILELDARGGTRYVESIYSRFGVISPDFRLQRPELIGQGTSRINIYAVPQTSPSPTTPTTDNAQGNLAAFSSTPILGGHGCRYAATEHGMIIGFGNVRADLTYQQGIPRMYSRRTRLDFYEPLLNGLGEQAVPLGELYADGTTGENDVFCYQERFAEYRFKNSEITGFFRNAEPDNISVWHVSQFFGSAPTLNSAFVQLATPMDRILAVNTSEAPAFLMDASYSYNHVRPMPIRSNPGIDKL